MTLKSPEHPRARAPGPDAACGAGSRDVQLARHLLHDGGIVSPFVEDILGPADIVRALKDS